MNKSMKKFIPHYLLIPVSVLLSTGVFSSANATSYQVRTDGNDSTCNGTVNAPATSAPNCAYLTVTKAANIAAAGDIVTIQPGTYSGNVTFSKSGTSGAPITFKGSGSPIIKGNVKTTGNYNIIDGVTVSPPAAGGYSAITLIGQHNTLQNCLVTKYGATAGDQATAITLENGGAYNSVIGCTIRDLNDIDVFHVFGHDQTIRNNYVTNINSVNYSLNHTDFFQTWGWSGSSTYNILVEGNTVTNANLQLGNTANTGYSALHDITFRNNIFANIDAAYFLGVPKTKFYNNVFYNVGKAQGYAVSYYNQTNYDSTGSEFKNNVFLNSFGDINNHSGVANVTIANNYFAGANYAAKSNTGSMGTNFVNGGDPKFVNLAGLDFHIQSGSVLIGKGVDLSSLFTIDKDGNTRSGTWDIGAYEFGSSTGTGGTITVNAPKNLKFMP